MANRVKEVYVEKVSPLIHVKLNRTLVLGGLGSTQYVGLAPVVLC